MATVGVLHVPAHAGGFALSTPFHLSPASHLPFPTASPVELTLLKETAYPAPTVVVWSQIPIKSPPVRVYVQVCVRVYVCVGACRRMCTRICTHVCKCTPVHTCTQVVYVYVHTCAHVLAHFCVYLRACAYAYIHARVFLYVHAHTSVHMHICVHVQTCVHVCMYTCTCTTVHACVHVCVLVHTCAHLCVACAYVCVHSPVYIRLPISVCACIHGGVHDSLGVHTCVQLHKPVPWGSADPGVGGIRPPTFRSQLHRPLLTPPDHLQMLTGLPHGLSPPIIASGFLFVGLRGTCGDIRTFILMCSVSPQGLVLFPVGSPVTEQGLALKVRAVHGLPPWP
ncbi:uncharacterized protein LOC103665798 [Ursus maritimus]|uniref:Uncharacterized protein LOC103665798 n=1 Tax=Ursus maritimus TaxID=29073 RepID=A0A8M1GK02_URSMA|nr:uncharacterized protein LOC103665798 [Ursus maritimus]XP_040496019.1 uncharacterized protein LOC103665798 [Ursus maritimus]XP_040496020.1 uncharacterized protein LOC103665798 [Ursus maritimus]XP_040496021.1 uncharacterized protein LOC103665798 [Ursus maritimus]XP_040496022.1 uncharacterized protein LOC103665798 [Ursus maritimus]